MAKNNFLLIFAVLILLVIVIFFFDSISGFVTSYSAAKVEEINPSIVEFDRYDSSKVINVVVDTGSDGVNRYFVFKSINGEIQGSDSLCNDLVCSGKISKNFIVNSDLESGEYYFEFERECQSSHPECLNLNKKIRSGNLKITHV